jgi:ABC-type nitrate/sulfonate/bicarbonate transport system substrate-binding protein
MLARPVRPRALRVGFVRLLDAAPLIAAVELGLFARRGLSIALSREIGWAALRHRATFGGLDVMHAPGPLPLTLTLGLGGPPRPCVAGLVLNLHGNAITLAKHLREQGIHDGAALAEHIFSTRRRQPLTLAVVSWHSSHQYLLARWLRQFGIEAKRDVRLVVVPPEQMVRQLSAGHIDGFCAGEPWNSLAVAEAGAWCPAMSSEVDFGHPEKVLMATQDFVEQRTEEFTEVAAAVLEACAWCDSAEGRAQLPALLARREYLDLPTEIIARSLRGPFRRGDGREETDANFIVFQRFHANEPSAEKALWMLECLRQAEFLSLPEKQLQDTALSVFRTDLFRAARKQAAQAKTKSLHEK